MNLADLVFPTECVICGARGKMICVACGMLFQPGVIKRAGMNINALSDYAQVSTALFEYKEKLVFGLSKEFARHISADMSKAYVENKADAVAVIPTTRRSFRKRGFNPAREVVNRCGLPISDGLKFIRQPVDQLGLSAEERKTNLKRSMVFDGKQRVLLFDDVLTTGATLKEAVRAIERSGSVVAGIWVLSATSDFEDAENSK